MDYYISSYLPSLKKNIEINKISFGDFFQLNLYIQNGNNERTSSVFDLICHKSIGYTDNITNLDKFYTLLNLYIFHIQSILKISAKTENGESSVYEIFLKIVLDNCKKYEIADFKIPRKIYYSDSDEILNETGEKYEDIEKHIYYNKIQMYDVPDFLKGVPTVYFNCFDNSLFHFCKLLYKTNTKHLYNKIKTLKKNYNFTLSEIYDMSPKELEIFLETK